MEELIAEIKKEILSELEEKRKQEYQRRKPKYKLTQNGEVTFFPTLYEAAKHLNVSNSSIAKFFENRALLKDQPKYSDVTLEYIDEAKEKMRLAKYGQQIKSIEKKQKVIYDVNNDKRPRGRPKKQTNQNKESETKE